MSALHHINVGLMLDDVVEQLPEHEATAESDRVRVAIIGRPNVGKSALVNAILGEERVIVSDVAGTTRDAVDTEIDTPEGTVPPHRHGRGEAAGQARQGRRAALGHADDSGRGALRRCMLVVDGTAGVTAQDTHIAGIPMEMHAA